MCKTVVLPLNYRSVELEGIEPSCVDVPHAAFAYVDTIAVPGGFSSPLKEWTGATRRL